MRHADDHVLQQARTGAASAAPRWLTTIHGVVVIATIVAAGGSNALAECQLVATAILPIQMNGGLMTFAASIDNKPVTLILSTGLLRTTLNLAAAKRLDIDLSLKDSGSFIEGGYRETYTGYADRFDIGFMRGRNTPVNAARLWPSPDLPGVDGAFGMDTMTRSDIDIDVQGHAVSFLNAQGDCSRPTVSIDQPLFVAPLTPIRDNSQVDFDVQIDGRRFRALLDSGRAHTAIYRAAAERSDADLSDVHATASRPSFDQVLPDPPLKTAHFSNFFIGSLKLHDVDVDVLNQSGPGIDRVQLGSALVVSGTDEPGGEEVLIGADLMQRVHFWVSRSSGRLVMQYPPAHR